MSVKISGAELEVMELLWESEHAYSFAELLQYFNSEKEKDWRKQTLNTYLLRLKGRNYVSAERITSKTLYSAAITRTRYNQLCAEEILKESYQGTLSNFIAALTGKEKLTSEEQQKLIKYITDNEE